MLRHLRAFLDTFATLAMLTCSLLIIWTIVRPAAFGAKNGKMPPVTDVSLNKPMKLAGVPTQGNPRSKVTVIEFSDFQCPFCGKFTRESFPVLSQNYIKTGKVRWAFRHLPLEGLHPFAVGAAKAAACAGEQDRFWEFHDLVFVSQNRLGVDDLLKHARTLGLDGDRFHSCIEDGGSKAVARDLADAAALNASSTPVFFVGRTLTDGTVKLSRRIAGAAPASQFASLIDAELAK
jgi:protein-disulfide isomerase